MQLPEIVPCIASIAWHPPSFHHSARLPDSFQQTCLPQLEIFDYGRRAEAKDCIVVLVKHPLFGYPDLLSRIPYTQHIGQFIIRFKIGDTAISCRAYPGTACVPCFDLVGSTRDKVPTSSSVPRSCPQVLADIPQPAIIRRMSQGTLSYPYRLIRTFHCSLARNITSHLHQDRRYQGPPRASSIGSPDRLCVRKS